MPLVRLAAVAVLGVLAGCGRDDAGRSSPVRLLDLDGRPVDLWQSDAVTVVVFTRTDCPIANRYAPDVRRLYEAYRPRGVEFALVYVDPTESPEMVRAHLRVYGYPCRGLRDPGHALVAHCGVTATPEAVVFARDRSMTYRGRIDDRYVDVGRPRSEPTTRDLADAIEATLAGEPVARPRTEAVGCPIADLRD